MATSKAKRLIVLAQPTPQPARSKPQRRGMSPKNNRHVNPTQPVASGLMPVKAHVYRSIAELNGGFEKVVHELQTLGGVGLFRASGLTEMRKLICRMRAQANRDFAKVIHDRENANAGHFE
jgi:hypothetical protein